MSFKNILVVSDNERVLSAFIKIINRSSELKKERTFEFVCSPENKELINKNLGQYIVKPLDVKAGYERIVGKHDLVISAHCKQIFPDKLVENVRCINIHPGYNPFNRGWYPQVFSIINNMSLGATIHEVDKDIDHGPIIAREKVELFSWDTSYTAYERVQNLEIKLLERFLPNILNDTYKSFKPEKEGNLNLKKDFENLLEIKLDEQLTFKDAITRLRALSHPPFKNAYFVDPKTRKKVWVRLDLEED